MKKKLCKEAEEYISTPIEVNDYVRFNKRLIYNYSSGQTEGYVKEISEDGTVCKVLITDNNCSWNGKIVEVNTEDLEKDPLFIGYDPFKLIQKFPRISFVSYELGSLLSIVYTEYEFGEYFVDCYDGKKRKMRELNWNPYVIDKDGNKQYYQRDFCWTVEDKQNLIESIYRGVDCGKIVLRKRSFDYVENELKKGNDEVAFHDIVDGKQRLNALLGFINNEFPDKNGKYYKDFSILAQRRFAGKLCFTIGQLSEKTTDEETIQTFMLVNFAGKSMSKEHLDYVDSILKKM